MGPKGKHPSTSDLFRQPLVELINEKHPLVRLVELIDWSIFETRCSVFFPSKTGRPATPPRWRQRVGEEGVEWLLTETIAAARRGKIVKKQSFDKIVVDTTVMEKAMAYPTDRRLLERGRQHLVKLARILGIRLRQNYNRQAPRLAVQVGRYAHAKQFRRMKATLKSLRTLVGRVWHDIDRKLDRQDETTTARVEAILERVKRVLTQQPKDKNKLYSLHAPEVECQPYEFGVKVTVATTHKEGLVVGMRSMPGNPYDGHSLPEAVEQVSILIDHPPQVVFVDKGYRGVDVTEVPIWRSGQERSVTPAIKKAIHRRSAIEPAIGHMKNDRRLHRNWLKGGLGDALHAVLCGAGHNLRMILRALRLNFAFLLTALWANDPRGGTQSTKSFPLLAA